MWMLDDFAANGPAATPAEDRFIITIKLGSDTVAGRPLTKPQTSSAGSSEGARPREWIKKAKGKYSQQYIFASLTPVTIQAPAAESIREKAEKGASPVYKIWLDHDLKRLANVSIVTVKADAARAAFSADGRGIVWVTLPH